MNVKFMHVKAKKLENLNLMSSLILLKSKTMRWFWIILPKHYFGIHFLEKKKGRTSKKILPKNNNKYEKKTKNSKKYQTLEISGTHSLVNFQDVWTPKWGYPVRRCHYSCKPKIVKHKTWMIPLLSPLCLIIINLLFEL